jgi:iron(III) transport system substrate-binding protein
MRRRRKFTWLQLLSSVLILAIAGSLACGTGEDSLTVYAGRSQNLVRPLLEAYIAENGSDIRVKYASSSAIAATILEEGEDTPADVVFLQDPGYLGSLSHAGLLAELPQDLLGRVDAAYRSSSGHWVGTSGRSRTVAYNTEAIDPEADLPDSVLDFADPEWRGRVGWAPLNASFQAFVTAFRLRWGEEEARAWLEGMRANEVREYANNTTIVAAVARREVDVGLVNHYYVERFLEEEGEGFGARNHFLSGSDPGALVLVAGAGILKTTDNRKGAEHFVEYLLSESAQSYFSETTKEYPLINGVPPQGGLPPLSSLESPDVDLGDLTDARGTVSLLREVGIIP